MKRLTAVAPEHVVLQPGFWKQQLDINAHSILTLTVEHCERTGRFRNFAVCSGLINGKHEGRRYNDSDVYKVLEGAAYVFADYPDHPARQQVSEVIDWIAAAQQPDGYLNTYFTLVEPEKRWKDIRNGHELYCIGHLIEAALAWHERHDDDRLLNVSLKAVEHVRETLGPADNQLPHPPGHQELELALIRLWDHTGDESYLQLARFFLEGRGNLHRRESYGAYCQDHLPIREQVTPTGHAVRLMYQCCGQADLARALQDEQYLTPLIVLWDEITAKHMYITGGIGSSALNEGFTEPYDLPNQIAYAETCAGIGMVLWSRRMFLATGQARYHDMIERVLYNAVLCGVSLDGRRFFYDNPLMSEGNKHRVDWFDCSCCPSNLVRFLPQVPGLVYAVLDDALYVNQFITCQGKCHIAGRQLAVTQATSFPWNGRVELTIGCANEAPVSCVLKVRIPQWCGAGVSSITVNGEGLGVAVGTDGYLTVDRDWQNGDRVVIELPMIPRFVKSDEKVRANRGRVAVVHGPIVYCLEQADLPDGSVQCNEYPVDTTIRPSVSHQMMMAEWFPTGGERGPAPSRLTIQTMAQIRETLQQPERVNLVPYFMWDNRSPGAMSVWLRDGD